MSCLPGSGLCLHHHLHGPLAWGEGRGPRAEVRLSELWEVWEEEPRCRHVRTMAKEGGRSLRGRSWLRRGRRVVENVPPCVDGAAAGQGGEMPGLLSRLAAWVCSEGKATCFPAMSAE